MTKKELKNLAKKIASAEISLSKTEDSAKQDQLKGQIMKLTSQVADIEDLWILDELIQDEINKKNS